MSFNNFKSLCCEKKELKNMKVSRKGLFRVANKDVETTTQEQENMPVKVTARQNGRKVSNSSNVDRSFDRHYTQKVKLLENMDVDAIEVVDDTNYTEQRTSSRGPRMDQKKYISSKPVPTGHMISATGEIKAYFPREANETEQRDDDLESRPAFQFDDDLGAKPLQLSTNNLMQSSTSLSFKDDTGALREKSEDYGTDSFSFHNIETFDTYGTNSIINDSYYDDGDESSTSTEDTHSTLSGVDEPRLGTFWIAFKTFWSTQATSNINISQQADSIQEDPSLSVRSSDSWIIDIPNKSNSDTSFEETLSIEYRNSGNDSSWNTNPSAHQNHRRKNTIEMSNAEFLKAIRTINDDFDRMAFLSTPNSSHEISSGSSNTANRPSHLEECDTNHSGSELSNAEFLQFMRRSMNIDGELVLDAESLPNGDFGAKPILEQLDDASEMSNSEFLQFMKQSMTVNNESAAENIAQTSELSNTEFLRAMQKVDEEDIKNMTYNPSPTKQLSNDGFIKALKAITEDEEEEGDNSLNGFLLSETKSGEVVEFKKSILSTIEEVDSYSSHSSHESLIKNDSISSSECKTLSLQEGAVKAVLSATSMDSLNDFLETASFEVTKEELPTDRLLNHKREELEDVKALSVVKSLRKILKFRKKEVSSSKGAGNKSQKISKIRTSSTCQKSYPKVLHVALLHEPSNNNSLSQDEKNIIKREIEIKELQGWTKLNASCSTCMIPLLLESRGNSVCISCGYTKTDDSESHIRRPLLTTKASF